MHRSVTGLSQRTRRLAGGALGLLVGAAALLLAVRGVDMAGLRTAFSRVQWWWVAAAAVANAVNIVAQGQAWKIGIRAGGMGEVRTRHAVAATWIGKAVNQLLPGKVGEVARIAVIRGHIAPDRRQVSRIVGSVLAQRVLNIVATLLVIAASTVVLPIPPAVPGGRWAAPAVLGALAAAAAAVVAVRRRRTAGTADGGAIRRNVRGAVEGAGLLRPGRQSAGALGLHLVAIAAQFAMMEFLLRGFAVSAPITAPLVIIALVGIAGAVPGAPGGAGLNQAALVAPLGAVYGVTPATALAFALGLQATLAAVAIAGGLVAGVHHHRSGGLRTAFP
jgi:uncharacterized membrane protein YbhN (UPF0104 family)